MLNDNHCRRTNCRCTHTDGCERGFIWVEYIVRTEKMVKGERTIVQKAHEGVKFCPVCDPERAHIQQTSNSSEELAERLRARSKLTSADNYERTEAQKTRTL
mgnify:CR=1 FL=1